MARYIAHSDKDTSYKTVLIEGYISKHIETLLKSLVRNLESVKEVISNDDHSPTPGCPTLAGERDKFHICETAPGQEDVVTRRV